MMPNIDPRALKDMMSKMGIKSEEIEADKVVISRKDNEIVITNPSVTRIEAQGTVSFQISGDIEERALAAYPPAERVEISEDDIRLVSEKTGVSDAERVRMALEETNGDIAQAILNLTGKDEE